MGIADFIPQQATTQASKELKELRDKQYIIWCELWEVRKLIHRTQEHERYLMSAMDRNQPLLDELTLKVSSFAAGTWHPTRRLDDRD